MNQWSTSFIVCQTGGDVGGSWGGGEDEVTVNRRLPLPQPFLEELLRRCQIRPSEGARDTRPLEDAVPQRQTRRPRRLQRESVPLDLLQLRVRDFPFF